MANNEYIRSSNYETLIRRSNKNFEKTEDSYSHYFQNLIDCENGFNPLEKEIGSFEKQLSNIKINLSNAFDRMIENKNVPIENRNILINLKEKVNKSNGSLQLTEIIDEALDITNMLI